MLNRPSSLFALIIPAILASCAEPGRDVSTGPVAPHDMRISVAVCGVCAGLTPVCNSTTKKCVGCILDTDCSGGAHCHLGTCLLGCSAQHPCGDAGICNVDAGTCAGCLNDADCKNPKLPFCDKQSGSCAGCSTMTDKCAAGTYCQSKNGANTCVPGCKTDDECINDAMTGTPTSKCCTHACLDSAADAMNCGACAMKCMAGNTCCSSSCIATDSDASNCGGCGLVCNLANATSNCSGGACVIVSCNNNYGDCDGNAANGCEANLKKDTSNCGHCGNSCVFACLGGGCFPF